MGTASVNAVTFVSDLGALVAAASQDLRNTALAQASGAASKFVDELIFLLALALISFAGVLIATNVLTRPLKKLATAAVRIHNGDFDLERLPASGPREVVSTITTFNDMTSILKSVEAKTVALSSEDLSHPALQVPLPGRTGRALQAAVDRLTTRIRDREVQRQVLQEEATHDPLTGLLNRHAIFDFLATDVSRRREGGETVAVLFADLDGLKTLNDTYGHEAGDTAIRVTAEALCQATGRCDVIGRVGGDEFLVVLCTEHSGDSAAVVERIRDRMTRCTVSVHDLLIPLFCSVGLALAECGADTDPMELVRRADAAMYEAKKATRTTGDSIAAAGGAVGTIA
jgi:diguanylate cyclase (GGDEF)-like protein